jgi:5-methyltetrahydrofolate--homocysteine methyltransferase
MYILDEIAEGVRKGDASTVEKLVTEALEQGKSWREILANGLIAGMEIIGKLFREEDIFIPEVLMGAAAMDAGTRILEPRMMQEGGNIAIGKLILGTVKGDVHDLGKKLVKILLTGAGFEVIDLGVDVPADRFVGTAISEKAEVVAMSALLTTTMPYMKKVVDTLRNTGGADGIKTIIGGACVNQEFAELIGADAYGENAPEALNIVRKLMRTA